MYAYAQIRARPAHHPMLTYADVWRRFVGNERIKLPPSRWGYGVVITNAQAQTYTDVCCRLLSLADVC